MCGLCGLVSEQVDWTDGVKTYKPRRQERYLKISYLNKILKSKGVLVSDVHGVNYLLQSLTGASIPVNGLGELWDQLENFLHKEIDVLDTDYLEALEMRLKE